MKKEKRNFIHEIVFKLFEVQLNNINFNYSNYKLFVR